MKKMLQNANEKEVTKEQVLEVMIRAWKKQVKKDKILEEYKLQK